MCKRCWGESNQGRELETSRACEFRREGRLVFHGRHRYDVAALFDHPSLRQRHYRPTVSLHNGLQRYYTSSRSGPWRHNTAQRPL